MESIVAEQLTMPTSLNSDVNRLWQAKIKANENVSMTNDTTMCSAWHIIYRHP